MMKQKASIANKTLLLILLLITPFVISSKNLPLLLYKTDADSINRCQIDQQNHLDSLVIQISRKASASMKAPGAINIEAYVSGL